MSRVTGAGERSPAAAVEAAAARLAGLPRRAVELLVHRLLDALDAADAPTADLEPEPVEDGDPAEASM